MKRIYVRVIEDDESWTRDDVERALEAVLQACPWAEPAPGEPTKPHVKGGYCLFLRAPEERFEELFQTLHAHGLLPCF